MVTFVWKARPEVLATAQGLVLRADPSLKGVLTGLALAALQIDQELGEELLSTLRHDGDLIWAATVCLKEGL